jgi:hypothetical protein
MADDPVTDDPVTRDPVIGCLSIIGFAVLVFGSLFIFMVIGHGSGEFAAGMFLLGEAVVVGIIAGVYYWSKRFLK